MATAHRAPRIHLLMISPAVTMATCSYISKQVQLFFLLFLKIKQNHMYSLVESGCGKGLAKHTQGGNI